MQITNQNHSARNLSFKRLVPDESLKDPRFKNMITVLKDPELKDELDVITKGQHFHIFGEKGESPSGDQVKIKIDHQHFKESDIVTVYDPVYVISTASLHFSSTGVIRAAKEAKAILKENIEKAKKESEEAKKTDAEFDDLKNLYKN